MTVYDSTKGGTTEVQANAPVLKILRRTLDLGELGKSLVVATDAFTAADVIKALNVPKNTLVINSGIIVSKLEGDTMTLDLGDGDDVDGYVDGFDAEAVGAAYNVTARNYGPDGIFYAAADTIDLLIATVGAQTSHTAIVTVWALVAQIHPE